ncbi:MAG: hypothetical protein Q9207_002488 [Kuettlingeria erythrocarpa]
MEITLTILQLIAPIAALSTPSNLYQRVEDDPLQHSYNFTLKSLGRDPSRPVFDNLYLKPYHIYPTFNYATLYPKSDNSSGIVGFLNGTTQQLEDHQGNLLFYGGGGALYGFVIDSVNATYKPVEINVGSGTQGIFIDRGLLRYNNPMSGGFYEITKE